VWKRIAGGLVALIALGGGGAWLFAQTDQGREVLTGFKKPEKSTVVRVETAGRGDLVRSISAPGSIEPRTKVEISAQVSARIVALPFREGQDVRKGDVVVRLDAEDLAAAVESARASLRGEEARLEGARATVAETAAELGRLRELFDSRDISKSQLDAAAAAHQRALANVRATEHAMEIARANITRAQKNLDYAVIISPIDGTITKLNAEVGELVVVGTLNNPGSVIMTIADLRNMIMRARVDETNIGPVRPGQTARVTLNAFPGRTFNGAVQRVRLLREVARDGTGYVETEIAMELSPGDRLFTAGTGNASIDVERLDDVMKIPSQAVMDRRVEDLPSEIAAGNPWIEPGRAFAWVVYRWGEDGTAVVTPVSIGSSDLTHTVILGGLREGDRVIVGPHRELAKMEHGKKIEAQPSRAEKREADEERRGEEEKGKPQEEDGQHQDDTSPSSAAASPQTAPPANTGESAPRVKEGN
jgi:HlyD family secretion protein